MKQPKSQASKQRRKHEVKLVSPHVPCSHPDLKNSRLVSETLLNCIRTGDVDSFRDVLISCLNEVNKVHLAKKAGLGRQTLYDLIDPKKNFNPELSTVSAIIRGLAE